MTMQKVAMSASSALFASVLFCTVVGSVLLSATLYSTVSSFVSTADMYMVDIDDNIATKNVGEAKSVLLSALSSFVSSPDTDTHARDIPGKNAGETKSAVAKSISVLSKRLGEPKPLCDANSGWVLKEEIETTCYGDKMVSEEKGVCARCVCTDKGSTHLTPCEEEAQKCREYGDCCGTEMAVGGCDCCPLTLKFIC